MISAHFQGPWSLFSDKQAINHFFSGSPYSQPPNRTPGTHGLEQHTSLNAMLGGEKSQHVPWGPWLWTKRIGAQPHDSTESPSSGPNRAAFLLPEYTIFQDNLQHYLSYLLTYGLGTIWSMGQSTLEWNIRCGPMLPACTFPEHFAAFFQLFTDS